MEHRVRCREIRFVAWVVILFALYRPIENIFFWCVIYRQNCFSLSMITAILRTYPVTFLKIQMDGSCCGIMAALIYLQQNLPVSKSYIIQGVFILLKSLMLLIPLLLLVGAVGSLGLKRKYLRILTLTAYVALGLNLIDIPFAFLFLEKIIDVRYYTFVDHTIIMDLFRALFLLIVIQFYKRPRILAQFIRRESESKVLKGQTNQSV